eukprot:TRINITY_DN4840_c1_g1_i1.p1 TRINITY_DN4840_c1_g1~~TRINITY_DN4840_c1_g1_i1.p1  ORF type:complete len:536 (+),score=113.03 TRINITY_DN4840_c1_g1_i1:82-1608(+)
MAAHGGGDAGGSLADTLRLAEEVLRSSAHGSATADGAAAAGTPEREADAGCQGDLAAECARLREQLLGCEGRLLAAELMAAQHGRWQQEIASLKQQLQQQRERPRSPAAPSPRSAAWVLFAAQREVTAELQRRLEAAEAEAAELRAELKYVTGVTVSQRRRRVSPSPGRSRSRGQHAAPTQRKAAAAPQAAQSPQPPPQQQQQQQGGLAGAAEPAPAGGRPADYYYSAVADTDDVQTARPGWDPSPAASPPRGRGGAQRAAAAGRTASPAPPSSADSLLLPAPGATDAALRALLVAERRKVQRLQRELCESTMRELRLRGESPARAAAAAGAPPSPHRGLSLPAGVSAPSSPRQRATPPPPHSAPRGRSPSPRAAEPRPAWRHASPLPARSGPESPRAAPAVPAAHRRLPPPRQHPGGAGDERAAPGAAAQQRRSRSAERVLCLATHPIYPAQVCQTTWRRYIEAVPRQLPPKQPPGGAARANSPARRAPSPGGGPRGRQRRMAPAKP